MRQVVCTNYSTPKTVARCLSLVWLVLCAVVVGCQLPKPPSLPYGSPRQAGYQLPPSPGPQSGAQQSATQRTALTAPQQTNLSASATIRGQTGDDWASSAPDELDNLRPPMVATETNPNLYVPPNTGLNTGPDTTAPSQFQGYGPPPVAGQLPPTTVFQPPVNSSPSYGAQGYGAQGYGAPGGYNATIAPGAAQGFVTNEATIAPGVYVDPMAGITAPDVMVPGYRPRERIAPLDVYLQEARTGRIVLGGSVNSDLGVAGNVIIEERNFDFRRLPRSWQDLWSGQAFRGDGQNFRVELMPGNLVERYTASWSTPRLFDYLPYSFSVGGFYYTRRFRDWTEQRIGGRAALGYELTKDLSMSSELRLEDVKLFEPRVAGVQELDDALGSTDLYTARFRIAHDTRDSPFMSTEGSLLELVYDQVFGEFDYPRGQINYSKYFLMRERLDGGGRHTLANTWRVGVTGSQTPIFENYFAGGYSTLRGFSFRGASPVESDIQVGGEFMFLGSLEYVFPLTADEMLRGVAFIDYGTVERDIEFNSENFRIAPGLGLRVTVPALGPAPLAFDFAYPINHADTDDRQVFSFFMGFTR